MPIYQPKRRQTRPKRTHFWQKEKPELKDLTFESKKHQARDVDKKKIWKHVLLGLMLVSTAIGLAIPTLQNLNVTKPKPVTTNVSLADAMQKASKRIEPSTSSEETPKETTPSTTPKEETLTDIQKVQIEKEVQARLEEATQKVVNDYNQKLQQITQQVQDANQAAAQYKKERDELAQKVATLEQQNQQANTPTQQSTTTSSSTQPEPTEPSRLVIPD